MENVEGVTDHAPLFGSEVRSKLVVPLRVSSLRFTRYRRLVSLLDAAAGLVAESVRIFTSGAIVKTVVGVGAGVGR